MENRESIDAKRTRFSIVVPVYQNEKNLDTTVPALLELRELMPDIDLELVFVDDGSEDESLAMLEQHAKAHPDVISVIQLSRNFGQTPAIQAGMQFATGDCVGIISADLQEPCEAFTDMLEAWRNGAKYVIAERSGRDEGRRHRMVASMYWWLIRRFVFHGYPAIGYDCCLIDRQLVDVVNSINEKNTSIFVLFYWLGYRPERVFIRRRIRTRGSSQWRFWKKVGFTLDTMIAFSYFPARMITVLGFLTAGLSGAYFVYAFLRWYIERSAPPGWATVVGLITLLSAAILISLGIISEYLLRILDESRKRPPFIVEQVVQQARDPIEGRQSGDDG